jgi:hypothetical protein
MNAVNKIAPGRSLLSVRDAAWALGVDQSAVCRAIRRGVLPLVKRRGRTVVPVAAVTRLLCQATTPARGASDEGDADGRPAGGGAP